MAIVIVQWQLNLIWANISNELRPDNTAALSDAVLTTDWLSNKSETWLNGIL